VLPRLRVGGRQLLEHEMPGPEIESLSTRIRDTARRVWILYVALTAVLFAILFGVGRTGVDEEMTPFNAIAHAFTTIPTAGFSTKSNSIEAFAPATQWVLIVFMILGGINFALMYRALVRRQPRVAARDEELRLYFGLLVVGAAVLITEVWSEDVLSGTEAVRTATFTAVGQMIAGRRTTTPEGLRRALEQSLAQNEPALIEVPVGDMPNPWPFLDLPKVRGL
jgi:trk system potassium uptake protein TrkH